MIDLKGSYEDFVNALGERESGNNYHIKNTLGYLGRWQFGKMRLTDVGLMKRNDGGGFEWIEGMDELKFCSGKGWEKVAMGFLAVGGNEEDVSFAKLVQDKAIYDSTDNWIKQAVYFSVASRIGEAVNGIVITLSGIVAGAHLKGMGSSKYPGVIQFVREGVDSTDAFGTKISEYIESFGGYDLSRFLRIPEKGA